VSDRTCDRCGGRLDPSEGIHEITTIVYRGDPDDLSTVGAPRVRVYCHRCGFTVLRDEGEEVCPC
jgi:rubrerythrin